MKQEWQIEWWCVPGRPLHGGRGLKPNLALIESTLAVVPFTGGAD